MFLKKKMARVIVTSFVCVAVLSVALFFSKLLKNGKGGFEFPTMPQYKEEISLLKDEEQDAESFLETSQIADKWQPLTYTTYRLRPGDMIGFLAERYGVNQDTLISVNNIRSSRTIQAGVYIKIPSEKGILYNVKRDGETCVSIAEKYGANVEKCAFLNNISQETPLKSGDSIFVPGAVLDPLSLAEINGDLFRRPIHGYYRLTSYFGWRPSPFTGRRSWHGGLDMACPAWTPIYAGMDGRVAEIGYNKTYGNYVIINHGRGYRTLYGHMVVRTADVRVGQYVGTNTIIGRVGSTGASTGPHVHFTVYKNGKMINPLPITMR